MQATTITLKNFKGTFSLTYNFKSLTAAINFIKKEYSNDIYSCELVEKNKFVVVYDVFNK